MTTHDRDKIFAAAREAGTYIDYDIDGNPPIEVIPESCWEKFYAIAFEDGRQAERIVTIKDDDDLRFIKRVLEGTNPTEEDKAKCLQLIREIRIRARGDNK